MNVLKRLFTCLMLGLLGPARDSVNFLGAQGQHLTNTVLQIVSATTNSGPDNIHRLNAVGFSVSPMQPPRPLM